MVGRTLTADADVLALGAAGADRHREERLHGVVAFIERGGNETGVAVEAERELRHVVRTDREAVEVFEELVGKKRIARDFAHHVEAKAVHAALEAVAFHDFRHAAGFINRTHERNHEFDVREAHFIAHELHRAAFHREAFGKLVGDVARGAAEAEHRIFFHGFVVDAADELAVFVALEVGETNDDLLRIEGGGNGRHAFGDLAFVEGLGGGIARGEAFNGVAEFARNVRVLEHDLRMDADVVVDDELKTGKTHALVRDRLEVEGELRVADIHHDLDGDLGERAAGDFLGIDLEKSLVDVAGVAFSAGDRDLVAFHDAFGRVAAADNSRNAELGSVMSVTSTSPGCTRSISAAL